MRAKGDGVGGSRSAPRKGLWAGIAPSCVPFKMIEEGIHAGRDAWMLGCLDARMCVRIGRLRGCWIGRHWGIAAVS